MATCKIPCDKCGSENTEVRATPPASISTGKGWLTQLGDMFRKNAASFAHMGGGKFVVCKDCGHISIINVL